MDYEIIIVIVLVICMECVYLTTVLYWLVRVCCTVVIERTAIVLLCAGIADLHNFYTLYIHHVPYKMKYWRGVNFGDW